MNARTLLLLAALAAATGCIDNDASVRMFGLCSAPTPKENGSCIYPAECEALALGRLAADVASPSIDGPLVWPVQMNNQRPPNALRDGAVETAYANLEGFKIQYGSAPLAVGTLTVPAQNVRAVPGEHPIDPEGTTVVLVPVIPPGAADYILGFLNVGDAPVDLDVSVRAYGYYGDGSSFETGPFHVEATICRGCFTNPALSCPADKPVYVGSCPQPLQSSNILCTTAATP